MDLFSLYPFYGTTVFIKANLQIRKDLLIIYDCEGGQENRIIPSGLCPLYLFCLSQNASVSPGSCAAGWQQGAGVGGLLIVHRAYCASKGAVCVRLCVHMCVRPCMHVHMCACVHVQGPQKFGCNSCFGKQALYMLILNQQIS